MFSPDETKAEIVKLDIDSAIDKGKYTDLVSDPNVIIESNETCHIPREGSFVVLKYRKKIERQLESFRCPILPFSGCEIPDETEMHEAPQLFSGDPLSEDDPLAPEEALNEP